MISYIFNRLQADNKVYSELIHKKAFRKAFLGIFCTSNKFLTESFPHSYVTSKLNIYYYIITHPLSLSQNCLSETLKNSKIITKLQQFTKKAFRKAFFHNFIKLILEFLNYLPQNGYSKNEKPNTMRGKTEYHFSVLQGTFLV